MKETAAELAPALSLIFQGSLQQSALPDNCKAAFVSPICKKGDRSNPANHRPVSLISFCCKPIEHIITSSVTKHLERHHIATDAQHRFPKLRSCGSQLILTVRDPSHGIEIKSQLDVIVLVSRRQSTKSHMLVTTT